MKKPLFCFFGLFLTLLSYTQNSKIKDGKYPSLLWEITGNGIKKPSYLFGTMHVSSKMAFNLSDSFYSAIRRTDVVALETNPESWQEDMFNFNFENDFTNSSYKWLQAMQHEPEDYLTINSLKFSTYERLLAAALASNPSAINNLLYRSYSERETDFEEDTYLDLYIYQAGKKWGKKILGVENYAESMKLAMEAYADALGDKNKKEKSYDIDEEFSFGKLQEAYRTGNLDLLDTINRLNSVSNAFDEKFLYRRNDIQAASIDSILKSGMSLFVGVGAAHLPGNRGVIEILRAQGYRLRPIRMGERSSHFKDEIEKIKVPVVFSKQTSADGFYSVDVPGKLYQFNNSRNGFSQQQYADMANGSYFMVTRVQTNALSWGHNGEDVLRKVDSLLYENIPGRILSKKAVVRNGYKGFDIVNRTRRGEYQRYNVFVTPFEVLFFKVSASDEYGTAAGNTDKFFNSISLKEYTAQWKKISPAFGGFEVEMPHEPYVIKNLNWQFLAVDKTENLQFEIIRTDIHNHNFVAEDSFDLALMEESFTASEFFEKSVSRRQTQYKGYPALDATYQYKDGSIAMVRYLLQGAHYYTIIAHGKKEHPGMERFLNSFSIRPFIYPAQPKQYSDTSLSFVVNTPYYPANKNQIELPMAENIYARESAETDISERASYRDKLIINDSTGEQVHVSFYKAPKYESQKDSVDIKTEVIDAKQGWIFRESKFDSSNHVKTWEAVVSDTNSSRVIWLKTFYGNGTIYSIKTETDSLTAASSFLSSFFQSFQPKNIIDKEQQRLRPSEIFFKDFFSADTSARKKAINSITTASFEETDFPNIKKAINSLTWRDKNYFSAKKNFLDQLGNIKTVEVSNYLKEIFYAAGDTVELQYKALENLLTQQNKYSFGVFRDIIVEDPPILNLSFSADDDDYSETSFFDGLYDSMELTALIAEDLLPLINIDDYKSAVLELMARLVDNYLLSYKDYASYVPKFLLEAKQTLKKHTALEKNRSIAQAQKNNKSQGFHGDQVVYETTSDYISDYGNETLNDYAVLLLPGWKKKSPIAQFFESLFTSNDQQLKYETMLLFIKNDRKVADSLLLDFAANDQYRYQLYNDLKELDLAHLFPAQYKNQLDLARSKLFDFSEYSKFDSIVFLQKRELQWASEEGLIYFFKYRQKKDDDWKLATVGLIQKDSTQFEFENTGSRFGYRRNEDFTEISSERLKDSEPLDDQLTKRIKQLVYAKRPSAKEFYNSREDYDYP